MKYENDRMEEKTVKKAQRIEKKQFWDPEP